MSRRAIFLDRDGTINVEKGYLHKIEEWEWTPGAIEAIRLINQMGFLAIVVSNQAGVAKGFYGEAAIHALHKEVDKILLANDARIDAYYYCPHHPDIESSVACTCRKPLPGMLHTAQQDFGIDLARSYLIGDKAIDIECSLQAGVKPLMVLTGYGTEQSALLPQGVDICDNLYTAVQYIHKNNSVEKTDAI